MQAAREFIGDMAEQISMPDVYLEIRQMVMQQNLDIKDFVAVIEKDSMLTTKLLRIANSPYFGFPRRAKGLYQALSLIGIMQLHDLILNCLTLRTFSSIPPQIFNPQAFWEYSVQCGIAARTIAQYGQIFPLNPYFTLGLIHEIGHAVMFIKSPELSLRAFEETSGQSNSLIERERELLGFDYNQAGTALMKLWDLPELHQQVTAFHLQPELADKDHRQAVRIINLAHTICQDPAPEKTQQILQQIDKSDIQLQKLPSNIDQIILKEIDANTENVLNMLWPNVAKESAPTKNSTP